GAALTRERAILADLVGSAEIRIRRSRGGRSRRRSPLYSRECPAFGRGAGGYCRHRLFRAEAGGLDSQRRRLPARTARLSGRGRFQEREWLKKPIVNRL